MSTLVVVQNKADWPLTVPDVEVVSARRYLTDVAYHKTRGTKVFNLCKSYRYQSLGYYVSLLAAARGHRPVPSETSKATVLPPRSIPTSARLSKL